jgi:hypothetical protein
MLDLFFFSGDKSLSGTAFQSRFKAFWPPAKNGDPLFPLLDIATGIFRAQSPEQHLLPTTIH